MAIVTNSNHLADANNALLALENVKEDTVKAISDAKETIELLDNARANLKLAVKESIEAINSKTEELKRIQISTTKNIQINKNQLNQSIEKLSNTFQFLAIKIIGIGVGIAIGIGIFSYAYSVYKDKRLEQVEQELEQANQTKENLNEFIIFLYKNNTDTARQAYQQWLNKEFLLMVTVMLIAGQCIKSKTHICHTLRFMPYIILLLQRASCEIYFYIKKRKIFLIKISHFANHFFQTIGVNI